MLDWALGCGSHNVAELNIEAEKVSPFQLLAFYIGD